MSNSRCRLCGKRKKLKVRLEQQRLADTYNGVCDTKCKVRQLILKPLLEKSTLSTHRKVQNCQVQVLKLRMQKVENSKVKILRSRKVQPSQICLCYSLISISSFSIVKLLHYRSGRVAYNVFGLCVRFLPTRMVKVSTNVKGKK